MHGAVERPYELDTAAADADNDSPDADRLRSRLSEALEPLLAHTAEPGRTRRILSTVLMPGR